MAGEYQTTRVKNYRKIPLVIQAIELTWENWSDVCSFVPPEYFGGGFHPDENPNEIGFRVKTLEGIMVARQGDYIVRGIAGEFYPVKKEIFENTYEPV